MGLPGVASPEVFAVLLETWLWLWDFFFCQLPVISITESESIYRFGSTVSLVTKRHRQGTVSWCRRSQARSHQPLEHLRVTNRPYSSAAPSSSPPHHVSKLTSLTAPQTALCLRPPYTPSSSLPCICPLILMDKNISLCLLFDPDFHTLEHPSIPAWPRGKCCLSLTVMRRSGGLHAAGCDGLHELIWNPWVPFCVFFFFICFRGEKVK